MTTTDRTVMQQAEVALRDLITLLDFAAGIGLMPQPADADGPRPQGLAAIAGLQSRLSAEPATEPQRRALPVAMVVKRHNVVTGVNRLFIEPIAGIDLELFAHDCLYSLATPPTEPAAALDRMADNARELGLDYEPAAAPAGQPEPQTSGPRQVAQMRRHRNAFVPADAKIEVLAWPSLTGGPAAAPQSGPMPFDAFQIRSLTSRASSTGDAHELSGDGIYRLAQMLWQSFAASQATEQPRPKSSTETTRPAPDDWVLVRVNDQFDRLMDALERADRKGYMPDAMADAWAAFDYAANVQPADRAQRDERYDALLEYFHASKSLLNTLGHEDATAEDENKAETRCENATAAVCAALARKGD